VSTVPNKVIYSMVGVSKHFDKKAVLKDIYLSYFYGAKIGVLGLNGSGKSSLLKILAGVDKEFNGETVLSPGHTVGYLEQEPRLDETKTVREIVEQSVQATVDLLKEYDEINGKFAEEMSAEEMDKLLERQGNVQEKLDAADAWDPGQSFGNGNGRIAVSAWKFSSKDTFGRGKATSGALQVVIAEARHFTCSTSRPITWTQNP